MAFIMQPHLNSAPPAHNTGHLILAPKGYGIFDTWYYKLWITRTRQRCMQHEPAQSNITFTNHICHFANTIQDILFNQHSFFQ